MNGDLKEIISMIGTIVLMIGVFVAAYYVSKFVGKNYKPRYGFSRKVTVIDSTNIGKDRSLLVVKAAGKVLLIGSTAHEFTLLSELDAEQFTDTPETPEPLKKDFVSTFRDVLKSKIRKPGEGEED